MHRPIGIISALSLIVFSLDRAPAAELPDAARITPVKLLEVDHYCEGVVFDSKGQGYISEGKQIVQFTPDGQSKVWAETGAPNGHKILADGTHLVCDASQHAVLRLSSDGKLLDPASKECDGKQLRGPNDLSLDTPNGGFYFTDPGGSDDKNPIGMIHYVDKSGKTHLVDGGLAFPNGIVLTPDGKRLLVGESRHNRILAYDVLSPGKVGPRKVLADLPTKDAAAGQIDNQPDGMCLDATGNLYVAHYGMRQVQVLNPEGKLIARYPGGNVTTSNVAFGGPKHDQLFVTGGLAAEGGRGGLFRLDLGVPGLKILPGLLASVTVSGGDDYALGENSQRQAGVPEGAVTKHQWTSKVFGGTERDYWVYVPKQYDGSKPACVMVFQDGGNYVDTNKDFRVPIVFDNLIHKKQMPLTIGIFINPGQIPSATAGQKPRSNRSFEYDTPSPQYAEFLMKEILPEVAKSYKLTDKPEERAICGISSGGICSFTVAWERPDAFRKVLSHVGSFTNIRGGYIYPSLIRKTERKPLRVFLQDGEKDLDNEHGSWPLANQEMAASLKFAGYDYQFIYGNGAHNGKHGGAILPESLKWLWQDVVSKSN